PCLTHSRPSLLPLHDALPIFVDDLTVRVYTKGVIPQFAASLSRAVFMEGSVMPKKYIETVGAKGFRDKPVGSGPWKFVRSVPGEDRKSTRLNSSHQIISYAVF